VALPNYGDTPASIEQKLQISTIPQDIDTKFLFPKFRASSRNGGESAFFVAMPEASMNEYCRIIAAEYDIRLSREFSIMNSITQTSRMQGTTQGQLRLGVLAANSCHHAGPDFGIDDVGRFNSPSYFALAW